MDPRVKHAIVIFMIVTTLATGIFLFLFFYHPLKRTIPVEQYNHTQILDHFSYGTYSQFYFPQRVFIDKAHWEGPFSDAPLLVYLGGQSDIEDYVRQNGLINLAAPKLKALVFYIEHRFYGESVPYGSIETAMAKPEVRGYLTIDQVLRDYVDIIVFLKTNLSIPHAPVIVMGCSYSGMLAAWFRLKYSNIAVGAVASSAPVFYFYGLSPTPEDGFCQIVSDDYKEINGQCHDIIQSSWSLIDEAASLPNGLFTLGNRFNTCIPLQSTAELKMYIAQRYILVAKEGGRFSESIRRICNIITDPSTNEVLSRISTGFSHLNEEGTCTDIESAKAIGRLFKLSDNAMRQWQWQLCTDLLIPPGCGPNTMLPAEVFDISEYVAKCQQEFGVSPRPNVIISEYGGTDLKSGIVGSNIIFSNSLKDPDSFARKNLFTHSPEEKAPG